MARVPVSKFLNDQQLKKLMKNLISLFLFLIVGAYSSFLGAQTRSAAELHRHHEIQVWQDLIERQQRHTNDENIDMKFYHLDIEIAIDSSFIQGNVLCHLESTIDGLENLFLDLSQALTVDSISFPCVSFYQEDDKIQIQLDKSYEPGEIIELIIYYHGSPINPGGYKGLVYETHHGNEPVIATLSTPFLAHSWYPCKDGPEDKADSVWIDITIDKRVVNGIEMMAVSNGVLEDTMSTGSKKTFKWRHRYPIVTYYIMAAISNYKTITDSYTDDSGNSLPLEYFVFEESSTNLDGIVKIPEVIDFFSSVFGEYPFFAEKFGMTQLGFYGAIENQTNVIQNSLDTNWFMVTVHEMAHMWFADMITCETWHDGWLNEGFATYSEALWLEYDQGIEAYHVDMNKLQYFDSGTVYLENTDDPFEIFVPIIYTKGAWVLHMLRGVVGDSLFFQSLKNYATDVDFMYKHSTTLQFQEVFENTCNTDLEYFFDQWIYDEYYPIYKYNFSQDESGKLHVTLYQAQDEILGARPVFEMPVPLYIKFEDNSDSTVTAWNNEKMQQFEFNIEKDVKYVLVDPDRWVLRQESFDPELPVSVSEHIKFVNTKVFPNPFTNTLTIEVDETDELPLHIELYDLLGRLSFADKIESGIKTINLSNLENGLYFYRFLNEGNDPIQYGKIIKN